MKILKLKKLSGKYFFAARGFKEVEEFWLTFYRTTINMKDYFLEDNEEIRKVFRSTMECQFEHDLYNKSFSNQLESDKTDTIQQRIKWWMTIVDRGCPIPNNIYDYRFVRQSFLVCIVKL